MKNPKARRIKCNQIPVLTKALNQMLTLLEYRKQQLNAALAQGDMGTQDIDHIKDVISSIRADIEQLKSRLKYLIQICKPRIKTTLYR